MKTVNNSTVYSVFIILVAIFFISAIDQQSEASTDNQKNSVVIFLKDNLVIAQDREGKVIADGKAGIDDAEVIQTAIDEIHPGGEIKILAGKYILNKSISVYNSSIISGQGRQTILVPPENDFAIRVETKEVSPRRWYHSNVLDGVILKEFAIDGEREDGSSKGKGIYFHFVYDSVFKDLWIGNTGCGAGLFMEGWVGESNFQNIYLMANGNYEKKEGAIVMRSIGWEPINNLQLTGIFVIFPNYRGLDVYDAYSDDDSIETRPPRLIFFSQSMFHGWMNNDYLFDLIHLKDVDSFRGVHFSDSRITSGQNEHALIKANNSRVTVSNSVLGINSGGAAKYGIHGTKGAKIKAIGNTFQGGNGHVLFTQDSEIIFSQNTIVNDNLNIKLAPASNSIITQNRFEFEANDPIVMIDDDGQNGSYNIVISNNIFKNSYEQEAVNISPLSITGIMVHHNIYEKD